MRAGKSVHRLYRDMGMNKHNRKYHEATDSPGPETDKETYRQFNDAEEAEAWAQRHYADLLGLPPENEIRRSVFFYTGSCYRLYNKLLRDCPPLGSDEFEKIDFRESREEIAEIQKINKVLLEHTLPENIVVYRFTHKRIIRRLCNSKLVHKGDVFSDRAFFSTTLVRPLLEGFGKENRCDCILKLYLPKGLPGAYVSFKDGRSCLNEQEFLLPPNIKFRILRIYGLKYPQEIECLAIPRDTENSAWHMDAGRQ
jgi:hypothetical protein